MSTLITAILMLAPFAVLIATVTYAIRLVRTGVSAKHALFRQICMFLCAGVILCIGTAAAPAMAAEEAGVEDTVSADTETTGAVVADTGFAAGMAYIAAAIVTGLSGIGGGIAVAAGAPAAIGATSEDPKAFGKALIFVALGEGIALYGLLVSILILAKV
jgi:V/A-type H+-transporting ATPase subunit K